MSVKRLFPVLLMALLLLTGCTSEKGAEKESIVTDVTVTESAVEDASETQVKDEVRQAMKLMIGETLVPVTWEKNASVDALLALVEDAPLRIPLSMYGGFEQVGSLGQSIVSDDRKMIAASGDVVLYSGDQIVVFYGSNSWTYTPLGHVELKLEEMTHLLANGDVTLTIQTGD